jgi:predicted Zn-ribbon and HTH transcriptional regulator
MSKENYVCRKCGFEFIAIPGAEEPPDCPECASDQTEKLELATVGKTTEQKGGK